MDHDERQELARLLKALGEYNRLSLVYELCGCKAPENAMCLCACCSVDASVVSRHLKALAQEDVVQIESRGRERLYSLNRGGVAERLRRLADQIDGRVTALGEDHAEPQFQLENERSGT